MTIRAISNTTPAQDALSTGLPLPKLNGGALLGSHEGSDSAPSPESESAYPKRIDHDALERQVEAFNAASQKANLQMSVTIHEGTRDIIVKLVDEKTKEVVREIPAEKYLELVETLQKLAGLNVDVRT